MQEPCRGCSDMTPPRGSAWIQVPHRMWFGRSRTATWGQGGVAFMSLAPANDDLPTQLKLYKIT